jgi:hypothetical protein
LPPHEERWWRDRFAAAVEALGTEKSGGLLADGRSLSLEAGIELALDGSGGAVGDPPGRAA